MATDEGKPQLQRVALADIDVSIGELTIFMLKLVVASIPAGFLLAFVLFFVNACVGGMQ